MPEIAYSVFEAVSIHGAGDHGFSNHDLNVKLSTLVTTAVVTSIMDVYISTTIDT